MASEYLKRAGELFHAALEHDEKERSLFLKQACGDNHALRLEVETLLAAHLEAGEFMRIPAAKSIDLSELEDSIPPYEQIGVYKIVHEIGRGGMGAVYLAERADKHFKKHVAIKVVKRGMDTDYILRRFRNERQILANFDHPNIARLFDGGTTESGLPYFVMEYVEGEAIDKYCNAHQLDITQRLNLFQQVCSAVSYAHRNLVIHRDIKPSNILVTSDGIPKLLDFGIAKILQPDASSDLTVTGLRFMTPEFASPEQAQGLQVTTATDVYSLAIVLYLMLTDRSPYHLKSRSITEVAKIITETQPLVPSAIITSGIKPASPEINSKIPEGTPERLRKRLRGDLDNIVMMALRKEPERRYQSVEQFSEDIRRHLSGLPILASKDTFAYRTSKFIQRNSIAVGIALFAFFAILISGGTIGFIQWRANQRAKFLQEFGQEAARIEGIMRYAYLLPLHNIEQEKEQVTDHLNALKIRMTNLGTQANGPGYYALGRGFLALHRYQDAYDHLIQAWDRYDYKEPHVSYALGLSLAMLYQENLRDAEQTSNKEQLNFTKAKLETKYRNPALSYIRQGASTSEAPEHVEAILAYIASDYSKALKYSDLAAKKITWLYEAQKLQGDIYKSMAREHMNSGENQKATELFKKSKGAYLEAMRKAQSDPQIYEGLCSLHQQIMQMKLRQSAMLILKDYEEAISYCNSAIQIEPQYVPALLTSVQTHIGWAYYQRTHGEELGATIQKAIVVSEKALKIEPNNSSAHIALGNAYGSLADEQIDKAGNPIPYLDLADKSFAAAVAKSPDNPRSHYIQGRNFLERAFYEIGAGKDPNVSFNKAIPSLQIAVHENPKDTTYLTVLGIAYRTKASYEISKGIDARKSLEKAIETFQRGTQQNPNLKDGYGGLAEAYLSIADLKSDRNENPLPDLDASIAASNKILTIDPQHPYALAEIGQANWKKGNYLYSIKEDPTPALESARTALAKALELNKALYECYRMQAFVEQIAARYAIDHDENPSQFFNKSQHLIDKGLAVNATAADVLEAQATLCLLRADHSFLKGAALQAQLKQGIQAADRSLAVNSQAATVHATRGQLYLRLARIGGKERSHAAEEAEASFQKAFKIKSSLREDYKNDYNEASKLKS
jgi:serine/threonine protein kinase